MSTACVGHAAPAVSPACPARLYIATRPTVNGDDKRPPARLDPTRGARVTTEATPTGFQVFDSIHRRQLRGDTGSAAGGRHRDKGRTFSRNGHAEHTAAVWDVFADNDSANCVAGEYPYTHYRLVTPLHVNTTHYFSSY